MSTAIVDPSDTGEIEPALPVGEATENVALLYNVRPPRRPDATGEIPAIRPDMGPVILRPARYERAAALRRGRGRRRHPSLLARTWRRLRGAW
jgi:hypothetical protein